MAKLYLDEILEELYNAKDSQRVTIIVGVRRREWIEKWHEWTFWDKENNIYFKKDLKYINIVFSQIGEIVCVRPVYFTFYKFCPKVKNREFEQMQAYAGFWEESVMCVENINTMVII